VQDQTTLVFQVPGLLDRPAVGTSCCVTSAEALIAQELFMLPGVNDAEIDPRTGRVSVEVDPDAVSRSDVERALAEIGYPPDGAPQRA
jgi:copper chaperone CopZ